MSKSIILVYHKKGADPRLDVNNTDVSKCEKNVHMRKVLSTTSKYEMVFDGIKTFNCSVNILMSEFGSLQT